MSTSWKPGPQMAEDHDDFMGVSESDRLNAILNAAICAIITVDTHGIIRFANAGTQTLFGHRPEAVLGKNVSLLMPDDVAREHDAHIARHVRTGEARVLGMSRNIRGLHADGTRFPVHISVGVIERDGICGYTAVISDLSALEVTQTRLTAAIDGIGDGFALFDAKGRLVISNAAHQAMFQLPGEVCRPGTTLRDHFAGLGTNARWMIDGAEGGPDRNRQPRDGRITFHDGRTVFVRRMFLANADMTITTRDETDLVRNNALINRAERLRSLGELTGGVAHDFNNMLAVIIGNLELLQPHIDESETAEMVAEALEAAELGARLTDRLLAFARRQPLDVKPVAINEMVLDTVALLKRTLGVDIELTLDLAPKLPPVTADRSQLESGLVNLAANARDAMPGGGRLFIETALASLDGDEDVDVPAGTFVRLSVADTGLGMVPDVRAKAFEPFFTTKEKGKGTGLGLSSLYGYCRQMGGALTVYSEAGKGSMFNLYLPLSSDAIDAPDDTPVVAQPSAALTGTIILVVEDDPMVRRTTVNRIRALGAEVVTATNAADALAMVDAHERIDAVFTDVVMPGGMDGYALAEALDRKREGLPVLLTSGYAEERMNTAQFERSGRPLLRKPYRQADLERAFKQLLE